MYAVPFFLAFTTPFDVTVAILLLLDTHMTFFLLFFNFKVTFLFLAKDTAFLFSCGCFDECATFVCLIVIFTANNPSSNPSIYTYTF